MTVATLLRDKFGVSSSDVDKAVAFQKKYGGRLEKVLVNIGALSEDALPSFYSELLDLPLASEEEVAAFIPTTILQPRIAEQLAECNWFASDISEQVVLFVEDPLSKEANQILATIDRKVSLYIIDEKQLQRLQHSFRAQEQEVDIPDELSEFEEDRLRELAGEAPTVNLLNGLIAKALKARASDMHLEPIQGKYRVRFRIDGVLQEADWLPQRMRLPVASRIKVLSGMDIAEKRRPQDGKIAMKIANESLDIRVSALPLNDGESIVMRFLRQEAISYDMKVLGLAEDVEQQILEDLRKTAGVILLTGPTGSGKTTSLYTFLDTINSGEVKIITLEDPVEYQLEGVNQVQVQPDIGFDFAMGLRSIVRQDPDVIMVGEIRDSETARIAMQSALTGHLVFSTVHTNDAPSAYTRLIDLGAEEYLLNAALVSIIAQRLVRKLCPHCCVPSEHTSELIRRYQLDQFASKFGLQINLKQPKGCEKCSDTGYKGRVAVVEYLRCDENIKALAKDEYFPSRAKQVNQQRGGRTLLEDGLYKALQGVTSIDEVIRVAG